MIFCFDTNAFIGPWRRTYPIDVFPDYWEHIDRLINNGDILIVSEAVAELEKREDDLYRWVKERSSALVPLNTSIQVAAREILSQFPGMINVRRQKSMADPFVVAHAQIVSGTVVTEEGRNGNKESPRIADVCHELGIECMNPLQFIRSQGLVFRSF